MKRINDKRFWIICSTITVCVFAILLYNYFFTVRYLYSQTLWSLYVKSEIKLNNNVSDDDLELFVSNGKVVLSIKGKKNTNIVGIEILSIDDLMIENYIGKNIKPIGNMQLKYLSFYDSKLDKLPVFKHRTLSNIILYNSSIKDLSSLKNQPLVDVVIFNDKLEDIYSLPVKSIKRLEIKSDKLSDLSILKNAHNLSRLWLEGQNISDISVVSHLKKLRLLSLSNTNVSDLAPLGGIKLKQLDLDNTPVSDLTPLVGISIRALNITNTPAAKKPLPKGLKVSQLIGHTYVKKLNHEKTAK